MRYLTPVSDSGSNLSGGQIQRILLSRALYKDPCILFLDEATSHLDVKNAFDVIDKVKSLSITRIFVAHRPETIKSADRIFELKGGRLTELNNYDHVDIGNSKANAGGFKVADLIS